MSAKVRKVQGRWVAFGVACAVAAALPCFAGEGANIDSVTVEGKTSPPPTSAPTPEKKRSKAAPAEENIGFLSGIAIGAVAGGPIGAVAGGITGALLGEHFHKQKVANQELSASLSGSKADKERLTQTVAQLDGSLHSSQVQQGELTAALGHARDLTVNIGFRTADANLSGEDIDQLTTLGQLARGMDGVKVKVIGHADPRGSQEYNTSLSKDRAESVAAVLENAGLDKERIVIEALGAQGAEQSSNPDDYAFQRRVSIKLIGVGESKVEQPTTVAQAQ